MHITYSDLNNCSAVIYWARSQAKYRLNVDTTLKLSFTVEEVNVLAVLLHCQWQLVPTIPDKNNWDIWCIAEKNFFLTPLLLFQVAVVL